MIKKPVLTPEEDAILLAYRGSDLTVAEIKKTFALTQGELYGLLGKAREPFRRSASASPTRVLRRRSLAALRSFPDPAEPMGIARLERRLRGLLAQRIDDLEDQSPGENGDDGDRTGQALSLAVRTLATLRRTAPEGEDDAADTFERQRPGRSLGELRDELRGHLERIRIEERARRGP